MAAVGGCARVEHRATQRRVAPLAAARHQEMGSSSTRPSQAQDERAGGNGRRIEQAAMNRRAMAAFDPKWTCT